MKYCKSIEFKFQHDTSNDGTHFVHEFNIYAGRDHRIKLVVPTREARLEGFTEVRLNDQPIGIDKHIAVAAKVQSIVYAVMSLVNEVEGREEA